MKRIAAVLAVGILASGCSIFSGVTSRNSVVVQSYSPDGDGKMKLVESKNITGLWSDGRAKYVETTMWEISPDGQSNAKVFQHVEVDRYDDTSGAVDVAKTKATVAGDVTTHATDAVATVGVSAIAAQVGGASTFSVVPQIIDSYNRLKESRRATEPAEQAESPEQEAVAEQPVVAADDSASSGTLVPDGQPIADAPVGADATPETSY